MINRVERARERLRHHRGQYPKIADETELTKIWISRFANGAFKNPGTLTLDELEKWLDAHSADCGK